MTKIKVEPKRCVRLKGRGVGARYTSIRGGVYDLDDLEVSAADRERLLKTDGVSEVKDAQASKSPSKSKKKGGDA